MRARIGLEGVHTGHARSRPTEADRSLRELHNRPESFSEPEDISRPQDIRGEETPVPTPAQPQRKDAAKNCANLSHRPLSVSPFRRPHASWRRAQTPCWRPNTRSSPTSATAAARSKSSIIARVDLRKQTLSSSKELTTRIKNGRALVAFRPFFLPIFTQVTHGPCQATPKP